ncbi:hypothetical protein ACQP2P_11430 [Dactylosporangium sp. CA-139114]|uniref:hypothetical protein n=1 Tax=Dactylosporangium sp. CA-139114 TaxID=3239931 RepID=UPI003D97FE94
MAESVASDLAIARLIQRLGGSRRRSVIGDRPAADEFLVDDTTPKSTPDDPETKAS